MRSIIGCPGAQRFLAGVLFVAAVAAAGGCGGSSSNGTSSPSSASTEAKNIKPSRPTQLPTGGLGSYIRTGVSAGDSTVLDLAGDGRYSQSFANQPSGIRGLWHYRDGKITFVETSGKGAACIGKSGTYSWHFSHGQLTLRALGDPCEPRRGDFTSAPFRRSG
jgi:hypothetical protein